MKTAIVIVAGALGVMSFGAGASAQEGLATSTTIQGHNTIQQAPSGGRVNRNGAPAATDNQGFSNEQERRFEEHNNAVSQICKGC